MLARVINISTLSFLLLVFFRVAAQGDEYINVQPFCAGNEQLVFANTNTENSKFIIAEEGPYYGCIGQARHPAWFYLQIDNSGDLEFLITQFQNADRTGDSLDVDFVIWGPFEKNVLARPSTVLSQEKILDCSYNRRAFEHAEILNAKEDEIYIFVILNFDGREGFISLQQMNGEEESSGSTDCMVLGGVLGADRNLCGMNETTLEAFTGDAVGYEWLEFDEISGRFEPVKNNNNGPELTVRKDGVYKVLIQTASGIIKEDDVEVHFYEPPVINAPVEEITVCAPNVSIDLRQKEEELLLANPGENSYKVNYYSSLLSAKNKEPIENPENYRVEEDQSIYVEIVNLENGCSSELTQFDLVIKSWPLNLISDTYEICVDSNGRFNKVLDLEKEPGGNYRYSWFHGNVLLSEGPELQLEQQAADPYYSLLVEDTVSGCEMEYKTKLLYVSGPEDVDVEILEADFGSEWKITVVAKSSDGYNSVFHYRLDEGDFQSDPSFDNISNGLHKVEVAEQSGCGAVLAREFMVVGYDRFFTPNGDGYNDYWGIDKNPDYQILRIEIYDRYGRLLSQPDPEGQGWDGKVNNQPLPENVYWFQVEYLSPGKKKKSVFKGHFSLIR